SREAVGYRTIGTIPATSKSNSGWQLSNRLSIMRYTQSHHTGRDSWTSSDLNSMTPETLDSIIILNYNGREHLEACLSSLHDLEFPKKQLEIIVVDNGSTDGSFGFVKARCPSVVLSQNETNFRFSKPANIAPGRGTGEYV